MKVRFKDLRETNSRKVFKRLYLRDKRSCPICGPNEGCNAYSKKEQRTWKIFRRTKWKETR